MLKAIKVEYYDRGNVFTKWLTEPTVIAKLLCAGLAILQYGSSKKSG